MLQINSDLLKGKLKSAPHLKHCNVNWRILFIRKNKNRVLTYIMVAFLLILYTDIVMRLVKSFIRWLGWFQVTIGKNCRSSVILVEALGMLRTKVLIGCLHGDVRFTLCIFLCIIKLFCAEFY